MEVPVLLGFVYGFLGAVGLMLVVASFMGSRAEHPRHREGLHAHRHVRP